MGHRHAQVGTAKKVWSRKFCGWSGFGQDEYFIAAREEKADRSNSCLIFRKRKGANANFVGLERRQWDPVTFNVLLPSLWVRDVIS